MFITATSRLPGFDIGKEHIELYGLEPVCVPDNYYPFIQKLPFFNHLVIEHTPTVYKKRYFKGCLNNKSKLLISRYGGIGDIQWIIPSIRAIREKFPNIQIRFACFEKDREMFLNCKLIDSLINTKYPTVDDVMWCDYYLDFFDTVEGIGENEAKKRNPIDISLDIVGLKPSSYLGYYEITQQEKEYAKSIIKVGAKTLALPLVASSPHRSWSNHEGLIELLAQDNINCVLLADDTPHAKAIVKRIKSKGLPNIIDLTNKTTLRQMVAICNECFLTVSNDTGIVPIMATLGRPVIALYSTVPAETRASHYPTVNTVQVKKSCSPCYYLAHKCKYSDNCLNTITAREIYNKVKEYYEK